MLQAYRKHVAERAAQGILPKPLDVSQMKELTELLKKPPAGEENFLLDLIINRIPPGVAEAAYIKAKFLIDIAKNNTYSPLITCKKAVEILGTMQGGYNIIGLIDMLDDELFAPIASESLSHTILIFDNFYKIEQKAKDGNIYAKKIISSWAHAEWFLKRPKLEEKITVTVFKVIGESTTDDLSPAQDAWSRPDIPLHALSMLKNPRKGIKPDHAGYIGPIKQIQRLQNKGFPLAYVGDIIGTGSSRKSATNSVLWFMGKNIPYVPNKKNGGICLGNKISPIFFNTMQDAGALPIELEVDCLNMGDVIDIYPYRGEVHIYNTDELLITFKLKNEIILDAVRAGGRIPLIIGRSLTSKARKSLGLSSESNIFIRKKITKINNNGFSLAQKIVGRACDVEGIHPGIYCEPKISSIGSQDTTGPMTRDELNDLACLKFSADLIIQSFCHTAAYPKPIDLNTQHTLPNFIKQRGGISLRPGDGIIHSWLNRMLLPDTVGTGGDSHTRFPIGISFPAGSGLVAFAATTGIMPLDMPESVLVRFKGEIQPGITLRDLVHSIPLYAIKQGLLTIEKKNKKNIFSGRIIEIEGLPKLKLEQAFELTNASAERSAAASVIKLDKEPIIEYLNSNLVLLKWMIFEGYGDRSTLERRIKNMKAWLAEPNLIEADKNVDYAAIITINLSEIKEPILCVPNDPDNVHLLSDVQGEKINEVFIGSCMTNISHFRIVGELLNNYKKKLLTRMWLAPPTKMDMVQLVEEGYYNIFVKSGARIEIPGCALCMGNQARVNNNATVVSTSTRNFPNRLGMGANVYLSSAEVATVSSLLGKLPTPNEYWKFISKLNKNLTNINNYLNFNQLKEYANKAKKVIFTIPL
ncbi:bifunctional aconitate hydratase 2/2-methylisocitrate dehydratase [Pantoea sp. Aalb]|uniref:bifunctional aconitate hydratase 2/2-methylisocitrate dehydratase n=1 Tax=Pantoea sp. Aalb TaxID=2576762 RepID=UPI00132298A8|nr:bifunctional aconitate hydratase 2/2-methylisocitrate dehydratase [Pantoea sp. Aalb]MXP67201.1 bifunctional aconitate hydratase 2/2-methylisocitrate dehydratase [Pantoea sp. Aalb]